MKISIPTMNDRLKILHTMTWLAPGGGVDNNVYLTLDGLKEEFDFHLAVGGEIYHNPFDSLSSVKQIICNDLVRPISPCKDFKALLFFWRLIRQEKYDIVHTHETKASLLSRVAAYCAGCRCIIYGLHGVTFNDPHSRLRRYLYIFLEKMTVWMSDVIVSVGQDCIDKYHAANIGKKIPYQVVYSGINIGYFSDAAYSDTELNDLRRSLGIGPDDVVLLNIGRFSHAKGQRYTIRCFAELRQSYKNLKLLLVGDGECKADCQELAKQLRVSDQIIFYGFSEEIPKLAKLSHILVTTSLREGLPRVVVEAALCRIPTVGFDVEGIKEIITDGESGFIVPQCDTATLVEKIKLLVESPARREEFARKAFAKACGQWDKEIMVKSLRELYKDLAKGSLHGK
jgi:glycosyltransferase involved in cell wall biosynthesis